MASYKVPSSKAAHFILIAVEDLVKSELTNLDCSKYCAKRDAFGFKEAAELLATTNSY